VTDYRRTLDLAAAAARLEFARNGVRFRREHFISAPDEVFVSRLTADRPGSLSFAVGLDRPERFATAVSGTHELLMTGTLNDGRGGRGVTSVARLRVLARGGSVTERANELVIAKADEVILLLAGATDYRGFAGRGVGDPVVATRGDLDRAAAKDYSALEAAHAADYQKWFNRVLLELPGTANSGLPTDDRLRGFAGGAADPALARLYFDFGRIPCVGLSDSPGIRFVLRR
jgi:alpha-L-fucosidase 2